MQGLITVCIIVDEIVSVNIQWLYASKVRLV